MSRTAVVLFNLGGPDAPEAVRPFLFNLFNDPAIIAAPAPIRWALAKLIAWRRAPVAQANYAHIGGSSPLLALTRDQAAALEAALSARGVEARAFVCMRYWHPMSDAVADEVRAYDPERVVLLPLYPQFSTTTTGSSLADWARAAKRAGLSAPSRAVCCYPLEQGWVAAQAERVKAGIAEARTLGSPRVLFSAHGLPKKIVAAGDPYQWQIEQSAAALAAALGLAEREWVVCYQSRVGPLEWIGPALEDELKRAASDRVAVVVVPIAFVSEHSETLVELDIEYRHMADRLGLAGYVRVPALGTAAPFIDGLAGLVETALARDAAVAPQLGARYCPDGHSGCPCVA